MGLLFNGTTQYLQITGAAPITAAPLSFSLWINNVAVAAQMYYMCISSTTNSDFSLFAISGNTTTVQIETSDSTSTQDWSSVSTISPATGTLYHFCGVTSGSSSRVFYLNGVASTPGVDPSTPTAGSLNIMGIGCVFNDSSTPSLFVNTNIYFPAMWNVALSAADVKSLSLGISPRKIRPANLVRYARLTGHNSPEPDMMKSTGWTVVAAPVQATNVRQFFP